MPSIQLGLDASPHGVIAQIACVSVGRVEGFDGAPLGFQKLMQSAGSCAWAST